MKSSLDELVELLMGKLFTTKAIKEISMALEELATDKSFKLHINGVLSDESLTDSQKRRQLSYVLKAVENPVLQDFFDEVVTSHQEWIFVSGKTNYFDNFVQAFQMATEKLGLVYLVTAIELTPVKLKAIALDLGSTFGFRVAIKHEVNPAILGGAQVRVENMVYDYSLRTKFQQFQQAWLRSLEQTEKKIGRNQVDTQ